MRISDKMLNKLIENEGELLEGSISAMGVLRLALDLRDARAKLAVFSQQTQNEDDPRMEWRQNMKTTVNFLEAVRALQEGKCEKIESLKNPGIYYSCKDYLGEWKLIGVKQKVVIENVVWRKNSQESVCPLSFCNDWSALLDKPKMKMTLEWVDK